MAPASEFEEAWCTCALQFVTFLHMTQLYARGQQSVRAQYLRRTEAW